MTARSKCPGIARWTMITAMLFQAALLLASVAGTDSQQPGSSNGQISTSYWDPSGGDCRPQHGVTHLDCAYIEAPGIVIDGNKWEAAWELGTGNNVLIPTASMNGSTYFFKSYINFTIVRDDEYVYFLLRWNDSTQTGLPALQDEVDLCWNISMENFTAYFSLGMQTPAPGERVDSFGWINLNLDNGTTYPGKDQCFGWDGWYDRSSESQDIATGFTRLNISNVLYYQVEMRRKLVTNDEYDVQFNRNGDYEVNFAVLDDLGHEDHAVSWNYAIRFTGFPEPTGGNWLLALGLGTGAVLGAIGIAHVVGVQKGRKDKNKKDEQSKHVEEVDAMFDKWEKGNRTEDNKL